MSQSFLTALIGSLGLMIAFYYGLTGFACAWFYRRTLTKTQRDLWMQGVVPTLGGLIMTATFVYGLKNFLDPGWLQDSDGKNVTMFGYGAVGVVGILAVLLGIVLMLVWRVRAPAYFRGETLRKMGSHDLVLVGPHVTRMDLPGLPDADLPEIVVAPDLSNLPPGATAYDLATEELVTKPEDDPGQTAG